MKVIKVKTLIPAPEDAVRYYITSTVMSIAADENGVPVNPNESITVTEWKKVGKDGAVVSSDMVLKLYTVLNGTKTYFGQVNCAPYFNFSSSVAQGKDSILAELLDGTNNIVDSLSIPVNKQGESAVEYELVPSESILHADYSGSVQTGDVTVKVYRSVGGSRSEMTVGNSVAADGQYYWLQYRRDGGQWYNTPTSFVAAFAVRATVGILEIRLVCNNTYATGSPTVLKECPGLRVVKDGSPGGTGNTGPMMYPAGIWDPSVRYESNNVLTPYVVWNNSYWYLKQPTSLNEEPTANSTAWGLCDNLRVVFIEALFAAFGKLGSAIFSGDWMISQHGKIDGVASTAYQSFVASDPEGTVQGHFRPNLALDLLLGKGFLNDAVVRGVLKVMALYTIVGSIKTVNGVEMIDLDTNPGNSYVLPGNTTVYLPAPAPYEGLSLTILFSAGSVLAYDGGIYMAYYTGTTQVTQNGMSFKAAHSVEGLSVLTIQSIMAYGPNSGTNWVVVGQRGILGIRDQINGTDRYQVLPDGRLLT